MTDYVPTEELVRLHEQGLSFLEIARHTGMTRAAIGARLTRRQQRLTGMAGKRMRRTPDEMAELKQGLYRLLDKLHPQTLRGLFYQAVGAKLLPKLEAAYKNTLIPSLTKMREAGEVPWEWVEDTGRRWLMPLLHADIEDALDWLETTYRRDFWRSQERQVMVVCEKDALSNILNAVTDEYGVALVPVSGFCAGFIHQVIEEYINRDTTVPWVVYYLGDYDPSGTELQIDIQDKFQRYASEDAAIEFVPLALTREQVDRYQLPTRPTKLSTHGKHFKDERSVELDALPVDILQGMVREAIERHIDWDLWHEAEAEQSRDRAALNQLKRSKVVRQREGGD
jgi:hypothetical protein